MDHRTLLGVGVALLLPACMDDGPPEPGPTPTTLVGSWQRTPSAFDDARADDVDFLDDGTMIRTTAAGTRMYDYTDNGASITLVDRGDGTPHEATCPFRLVRGGYLANALEAEGPVDGAVGSWTTTAWVGRDRFDQRWDLHGDGSALVTYDLERSGTRVFPATWEARGDDLRLNVQVDTGPVELDATVNGRFIGVPAYQPRP